MWQKFPFFMPNSLQDIKMSNGKETIVISLLICFSTSTTVPTLYSFLGNRTKHQDPGKVTQQTPLLARSKKLNNDEPDQFLHG